MTIKRQIINDGFRISQEKMETGWNMPFTHYHPASEIFILETGERTVNIGETFYLTSAHDAALFLSNVPHSSSGTTPFSGICIHFSEAYLHLYFRKYATSQLMKCFQTPILHLSDTDFKCIKEIANCFKDYEADNYLKLATILNILCRSQAPKDAKQPADEHWRNKASEIIEYTEHNYTSIQHVSDISNALNTSEGYVYSVFQEHYKVSPKKYVTELKLHHICHLLEYSSKSIKELSDLAGFHCYEHFLRTFKKNMGCTPTEYRKNWEQTASRG